MEEIKINPSGDETQEQGLNQEQGQAQGQKQDQEQEHQEQQAHPVIDGHPEFEFTITNSELIFTIFFCIIIIAVFRARLACLFRLRLFCC